MSLHDHVFNFTTSTNCVLWSTEKVVDTTISESKDMRF